MAWLETWAYRFEIKIDSTKIDSNLINFPVMIYLSSSCGTGNFDATDIFDELGSDKLKIAVTQSDGTTEIYCEVEYWDDTGEEAYLHIKVPSVASGSDTTIYLYFDSTESDNTSYIGEVADATAANVWDANFTHVYHLSESGNGSADEFKNSAATDHGTGGSSKYPDRTTGKVGYGQGFGSYTDGEYILCDGANPDGNTAITVESIFKPGSGECVNGTHKVTATNPGGNINGCFYLGHSDKVVAFLYTDDGYDFLTGATSVTGGTWYYSALKWESGETIKCWLNDNQEDAGSSARTGAVDRGQADQFEIGNWHQGSEYELRNGVVDEVRISDSKRSDAWNKATYYTLFDDLVAFEGLDESTFFEDTVGVADSIDTLGEYNVETSEGIGLDDYVHGETPNVEIADDLGLADLIFGDVESIMPEIGEGVGLADVIYASIFPGRLTDGIGIQDVMQGAFEYPVDLTDGIGLADVVEGFNWTQWKAENYDKAIKKFYFTLTGSADLTTDVEIPISSFQARKRSGYDTYLSVSIPGFTYSTQVSNRANGQMVLELAYELNSEEAFREEFIRVNLDRIDLYEGARNRSISLIGYRTQTFVNQNSIIENPNYKSNQGGTSLYRFPTIDPYVNPGDSCFVGDDSFTIDYITYTVSERSMTMEVKEIS